MKQNYDPHCIEKKWQKSWKDSKTFKVNYDPSKTKYYVLDMFPYPSGSGLHVGHVTGYTATDILSRYKRQMGFNVLHPMGWDSFGLPAEQYAVRTGTHPAKTTEENIYNFRRQLESLGFFYDWDREIRTSDPKYYKWTQWIFSKLFEKGLAYEADVLVNYCPELGTVLANEEVENGRAKEGGYLVERHPLRQWVLKITAYADRLIEDLDMLDWPESLKKLQRNWIGRSEGVMVDFIETQSNELITVFTTRPDTLFGATYMVLSPEHRLVDLITSSKMRSKVEEYKALAASKSDLERAEISKEKTGVWTGAYAINPVNREKVPIWIADYVLATYGTGAIMAVPAHDERDFDFAKKFKLPIRSVYDPGQGHELRDDVLAGNACWSGLGFGIHSQNDEISLNGLKPQEAKEKITDWLEKKAYGKRSVHYKLRDWLFSRQRYWGEPFPILHFKDGSKRVLELDELPLTPPPIDDYRPCGNGKSPLAKVKDWVEVLDPKTNKKAIRETNTMPQWAGSCWYYLRFCDPHNDEKAWAEEIEKYWMPVDMYVGGVEHAVLHLLYSRFWHKVLYDCSYVSTPEPFMKLRNQGIVTSRSYRLSDGNYLAKEDVIEKEGKYYSLKDQSEVFSQIEKMSKSKLNGVSPDDVIEEFGADSLRLYAMFMGPLEKEKPWNTDSVSGCKRFLSRVFDLVHSDKVTDKESHDALCLSHRLIEQVQKDIEALSFNTAIAKMMEFINVFTKFEYYPKSCLKILIQLLCPFAPHLAEDLWNHLGGAFPLIDQPFPKLEEKYLVVESVTYVVQVNGKLRARMDLPKDKSEEEILSLALANPNVKRHLDAKEFRKIVFVPNKLLNIVV